MFFNLVFRFCIVILPIVNAVQVPVESNNVPQHYPRFHEEFLENINRLTNIHRHNLEYIKPSIELGSFTIQTIIPSSNNKYENNNGQFKIIESPLQTKDSQKPINSGFMVHSSENITPPTQYITPPISEQHNQIGQNNAYLPPRIQTNRHSLQVEPLAIPMPQFLQNLPRPHQTYTQATPKIPNSLESNTQIKEQLKDTIGSTVALFNSQDRFNHNSQIQAQIPISERKPHQAYGPPLSTIDNRIRSHTPYDHTPFQQFRIQVERVNQNIPSQQFSETERKPHQNYGPPNFNSIVPFQGNTQHQFKMEEQESQFFVSERKPHQTYGPVPNINKLTQPKPILETKFLPKTNDELQQTQENSDSIHAEKFPPNDASDARQNEVSPSLREKNTNADLNRHLIESSYQNQQPVNSQFEMPARQNNNYTRTDTKYASDGGYIY